MIELWWCKGQSGTSGLLWQQREGSPVGVVHQKLQHLAYTAVHIIEEQVVSGQIHNEIPRQTSLSIDIIMCLQKILIK